MHLLSIPLLATVALAASNVLRPFVPVILPVGTIVNQQNPKPTFGVIVDTIDAYQSFNFDLKVPNGTLYAGVAKFSLPCGVAGSVTSSKFPFDKYNDTPGNYTLITTATYKVYAFSNCTGATQNYTNAVTNFFTVAPAVSDPLAANYNSTTTSMAFPSTYTVAAYPFTIGAGQANSLAPPTSGASTLRMGMTAIGMGAFVLVALI